MRNPFLLLSTFIASGLLCGGCAGPEVKLGRGINNTLEIVRGGEMRRHMEQSALFEGADVGYATGFVRGAHRSLRRTFVGVYEILTFPIPSYDPIVKPENPVYPDSYKPNLIADQMFSPDAALGFGGGDVAPFVPGSRFRIFDY